MQVQNVLNHQFMSSHVIKCDLGQIAQSPLIRTVAIAAIGAAIAPLSVTAFVAGSVVAICVFAPEMIPGRLLYEASILDLIVRAKLTSYVPSVKQQWWHEITPNLYLGGIPLANYNHHKQIKALGVKAVLNIMEDFEAKSDTFMSSPVRKAQWEKNGIELRRIHLRDMTPVPLDELKSATKWIHLKISHDKPVFVHCKAGRGRSAMTVIAYLMRYKNMTLQQARAHAQGRRIVVGGRPAQIRRLEKFEAWLKSRA